MPATSIPRPEHPRPSFVREDWINLNGKWTFTFDFGARIKIRETAAGSAWLSLEIGHSLVDHAERDEYGVSGGETGGIIIAAEQVFRIPIQGPAYGWQVDNRASLDISAGPYLLNTKLRDVGVQGGLLLSLYWLEVGPSFYFGTESGFGAGLEWGLHVAF